MGAACTSDKPVTQTTILTDPVLKPTGETIYTGVPKQTIEGNIVNDKNVPLYIRKLHTWASENAEHHHTKKFALPRSGTLVVRRGQPFKITLTFNRPYNSLTDELKFYFETGEKPLPGNDTMVCLSSYTSLGSSGWKSDFLPVVGTKARDCVTAHLWVFTPPDCVVADWKFSLQSIFRTEHDTATVTYEHPERIYILFNPWCKSDTVYFPAEPLLDEYVMNSAGIMFQGCRKRMTVKPWVFGQFESGILEACIYLIKRAFNFRTSHSMGDPVLVGRNIAKIVSADNNNGVMLGKWSTNDFEGGRSPTTWSGSVAILKQYVENAISAKGDNPEPVKYGHCFVFAGLVTTICRAVGIPCRCVTNYNSGFGNDGCLSIDYYYEVQEDGSIDELEDGSSSSVWSFHVWNDVWMRRSDLGPDYSEPDWQALDATPQISSSNVIQSCGPAPLCAIKNGLTDVKYDAGFLLAEVNADVLYWLKVDKANWTVFRVEESRVGRSISTKNPDGRPARLTYKFNMSEMTRIRQDISSDYKYKKGTKMEQELIKRPARKERPLHRCSARDVEFRLIEKEYEYIGEDFYLKANVTNKSVEQDRTVKVQLMLEAVHYNGRRHQVIKKRQFEKVIPPGGSEEFQLGIYENEYVGKLAEHTCLKQYGFLRVDETAQIAAYMDDFLLQKPHLELKPPEEVYCGKNFELKLLFKNPLHRSLTRCAVSVEGAGLESMLFIRNLEKIPAQCEWTGIVNLMPIRARQIEICATFHCKQMFDVIGKTVVMVQKQEIPSDLGTISPVDTDINKSVSINI